jgi:hypothetical protein
MTTVPPKYRYEPLSKEKDEIRLVTVLPSSYGSSPIQCTLSTASINDRPEYIALSYTWGASSRKEEILCGNAVISVTDNLSDALLEIRNRCSSSGPVTMWIDAICIDQETVDERNHQVRLMRRVYAQAMKVYVWLGRGGRSVYYAMDLAHILGSVGQFAVEGQETDIEAITKLVSSIPGRYWQMLEDLFKRP